jgi:hypothetical protein
MSSRKEQRIGEAEDTITTKTALLTILNVEIILQIRG